MIEIKQLFKTYYSKQQAIPALINIDLAIQPGEIYGILGKSGAGKSTLLRTVNLLEQPCKGQVFVNGTELTTLSPSKLKHKRRQIGMIFQHFNLLQSRTAFDNVALPLKIIGKPTPEIQQRVTTLLELVGLGDRQQHYPSELSGGQKQRVAIARALATQPDILLCDEATSALDPDSTLAILRLLKEINIKLGLTILLITHELDVVQKICDRVGILEAGELVEEGCVADVFADPKTVCAKRLLKQSWEVENA